MRRGLKRPEAAVQAPGLGTIAAMWRVRWLRVWTVRLAVCVLLLEAAVPGLASVAAQWRGVTVAEVCDAYGVHTVVLDQAPLDEPATLHADGACALTLLAAAAPMAAVVDVVPGRGAAAPPPDALPTAAPRDACADWGARLRHAPPTA